MVVIHLTYSSWIGHYCYCRLLVAQSCIKTSTITSKCQMNNYLPYRSYTTWNTQQLPPSFHTSYLSSRTSRKHQQKEQPTSISSYHHQQLQYQLHQYRNFEILIDPKKEHNRNHLKKKKNKGKSRKPSNRFIDRIRIRVQGGLGGKGSLSSKHILSKKKAPKLSPDGGHGGNGGCVILIAGSTNTSGSSTDSNNNDRHSLTSVSSLRALLNHYIADSGTNGGSQGKLGRNGRNLIITVPPGVIVKRIIDPLTEHYNPITKSVESIIPFNDNNGYDNDNNNMNKDGNLVLYNYEDDDDSHNNSETDDNDDEVDDEVRTDDEEEDDENDDDDDDQESNNEEEDDDEGGIEFFEMTEDEVNSFDNNNSNTTNDSNTNNSEDLVIDADNENTITNNNRQSIVLADLDQSGSYIVVAKGGRGGMGTIRYSSRHGPLPDAKVLIKNAQPIIGEVCHLELELKLLADIGLVGYPNAGKSSLLRAMSYATPYVASYPFTTLHPILGCIEYKDGYQITVADMPGLIKGASIGRGKGYEFLKHIERTKALLFIVDIAGVDGRNPIDDLYVIANEVDTYGDGDLLYRPAIVVANKIDLLLNNNNNDHEQQEHKLYETINQITDAANEIGLNFNGTTIGISAGVSGIGLDVLSKEMRRIVVMQQQQQEEEEEKLQQEQQLLLQHQAEEQQQRKRM